MSAAGDGIRRGWHSRHQRRPRARSAARLGPRSLAQVRSPKQLLGGTVDRSVSTRRALGGMHRVTAVTVVVLLVLAGGVAALVRSTVRRQESRLLTERTNELSLVFTTGIGNVTAS